MVVRHLYTQPLPFDHILAILNLISLLHIPRGNHDTWNTPRDGYIDYRMLVVQPFATSGVQAFWRRCL